MRHEYIMAVVLLGCTDGSASLDPTDTSDIEVVEPDWATEVPGLYDGVEESATLGSVSATFEVAYDEQANRFDVYFAPGGTRAYAKLYFQDVEVADDEPNQAFVTLPDQIYAKGQTGPTNLMLEGAGTVGPDARDGRVNLDRGRVKLQALIGASGEPEAFTLTLTRQ